MEREKNMELSFLFSANKNIFEPLFPFGIEKEIQELVAVLEFVG